MSQLGDLAFSPAEVSTNVIAFDFQAILRPGKIKITSSVLAESLVTEYLDDGARRSVAGALTLLHKRLESS